MNNGSDTLATTLGRWIASCSYDRIPQEIVEAAKDRTLDTLGCIVFSGQLPFAGNVLRQAETMSPGEAVIPGSSVSVNPAQYALLGGTLAASFELDDLGVYVHPGACVIPAAMASCFWQLRSNMATAGAEFLAAVCVGYEVMVRVSDWIGFIPEQEIGWHTPAFHGAIGAAAACARVMNLSHLQTAHAVAIAADLAGGGLIQARFGSDVKKFHTGRAAHTGFLAAIYASIGLTGRLDVFDDSRWGYQRVLSYNGRPQQHEETAEDGLLNELGKSWMSFARTAVKYYPTTSGAHSIMDNVRQLCLEHDERPQRIQDINIGISSWFMEQRETLRIATNLTEAPYSYPFAAAVASVFRPSRLTEPGMDPQVFVGALNNSLVSDLQTRVRFWRSDILDRENAYSMDSFAEIRFSDGVSLSRRSNYGGRSIGGAPVGAMSFAPVDRQGIRDKFRNLVLTSVSADVADRVVEITSDLDRLPDIMELANSLADEKSL